MRSAVRIRSPEVIFGLYLESKMKQAAKNFEFEKAALLRDEIVEIRREISGPQ